MGLRQRALGFRARVKCRVQGSKRWVEEVGVYDLGVWGLGLGSRVWGLGFRVQGLGFRV